MWLILDDCFTSNEMEPGPLTGLMEPSHLRLTNSTSKFSQLWKTSGEAAERRNSFLHSEVLPDKTVQSAPGPGLMGLHQQFMLRRGEHSGTSHDSQALQSFQRAASEACARSREDAKASPADSRNAEGTWRLQTASLVPFLGKLWNTPSLESIQNTVSDIRNSQTLCSLDIPRFCEWLSLP